MICSQASGSPLVGGTPCPAAAFYSVHFISCHRPRNMPRPGRERIPLSHRPQAVDGTAMKTSAVSTNDAPAPHPHNRPSRSEDLESPPPFTGEEAEVCKGEVTFLRSFHEVTWSGFDPKWPLSHPLALKQSFLVSNFHCLPAQPFPTTGRQPFPLTQQPTKHHKTLFVF